ncbi:MAG TPA: hypothetical protein VHY19_02245 [Steroidobacteraceae bacterium]|nr:hypothetical protein [Steroidobacteraceae bacterium]
MRKCRGLLLLAGLIAPPGACLAAQSGGPPKEQAAPSPGQTTPGSVATSAPQTLPKVCLDAQSGSDHLITAFADRLRETISASGALSLASPTDACNLQLHIPGNLLRFQTAAGLMVSTVVIVTSPSGRYLSASISACRAVELQPCAVRAVAAAKLAVVLTPSEESSEAPP